MHVGVKFGMGESISPQWCNVSPLWGEKPQDRHPPSNLNTNICAAASCGKLNVDLSSISHR